MPVNESPLTVTVGEICFSCAYYATGSCPYGNHKIASSMYFKGDIRGKCNEFSPIVEARSNKMKKTAENMKDSQLNVEIYRKIMAVSDKERDKVIGYWDKLFPHEYSVDMATDDIETGPKNIENKDKTEEKANCNKKEKVEEDKKNDKKEKDDNVKNWYKKPSKKNDSEGKRKDVFSDGFKS